METVARKPYPTDLTDAQWAILEPLVPPAKHGGRPRTVNIREVINTILYLNRSGCQWDMLPHDLLPKSTAYEYFAQWRDDGTWAKFVDALRRDVRTQEDLVGQIPREMLDRNPPRFGWLTQQGVAYGYSSQQDSVERAERAAKWHKVIADIAGKPGGLYG